MLLLLVFFGLGGCASVDPLRSYNRAMHGFNDKLDNLILQPVAKGYDVLTPKPVDRGVSNFFSNLFEPWSAINLLLQGRPDKSAVTMLRFLVNSTLGIGGLFDVATRLRLPQQREDFGQTLGVWGVPPGPYLVLPGLGPSNLRDAGGLVADALATPMQIIAPAGSLEMYLYNMLRIIDSRADFLAASKAIDTSNYSLVRDAYLQSREFNVRNGVMDEDPFLDEFEDDEFEDDEFEDYYEDGYQESGQEEGALSGDSEATLSDDSEAAPSGNSEATSLDDSEAAPSDDSEDR